MTDEEITQRLNKLAEIDPELVPVFLKDPDNFDYSQLEGYSAFTDKYKNVADFTGDKAKIMSDLWQQMDGKYPSDARMLSIQQQYPFINKDELYNWFDKSNAYKAEYEAEREAEAARKRREQEVAGTYVDINDPADTTGRNWGFLRNILASDYEKQRYIDAPQEAIFGYEAPGLAGSSTGAKADLAAGIAGGVADAMPFVKFAPIGPAIRTSRDVAHKVTDSPYQKEWSDVAADFSKDIGFNLGAAFLANAKRGAKIASLTTDPKVGQALALADETKNIEKGAQDVVKNLFKDGQYAVDDKALYEAIAGMPESELKQKLVEAASVYGTTRPIDRANINTIIAEYLNRANPTIQKLDKISLQQGTPYQLIMPSESAYSKLTKTAPLYNELTKGQKAQYNMMRAVDAINKGGAGQAFFQVSNTARGRGNQPNIVETALRQKEKEDTIDRMISSYSLLWNTKNPPPEAKDSPLIKAAWEKWKAGK